MAYDDIRITQLPEIQNVEDNDSIIINDATNDLTYRVDWRDLKNSIGTISNGITFPLGERDYPSVAIGDATSGIWADDYGKFNIVTHARDRIRINQAGTTEIINGNVVIGNFDKACYYNLTVNNITRFNCLVYMEGGLNMGGVIIDGDGNIITDGNLIVGGDVELGTDCDNTIVIKGELIAECDFKLLGNVIIGGNIVADGDLTIKGDVSLGSGCDSEIILNGNTTVKCDLAVDKDLTVNGSVDINAQGGSINIGHPDTNCNRNPNEINLNGQVNVLCDLNVGGNTNLEGNLGVEGDLEVLGDIVLGSDGCDDGSVTIDAPTQINCDTTIDGNITINGEGPHVIGPGGGGDCANIELNGNVDISCDLAVGGDTNLKGDLNVEGGLVVGPPGGDCDDSPDIDLNGNVNISCDLKVDGTAHLNKIIIDRDEIIIGLPPGGGFPCYADGTCPDGYECVDNGWGGTTCIPTPGPGVWFPCGPGGECPDGYVCVDDGNGGTVCIPEGGGGIGFPCNPDGSCPPGFQCVDDGLGGTVCMPIGGGGDCDTSPDIELNGNVDISCDLTVGGDLNIIGNIDVGGGNIQLGEKCTDIVKIGGTLDVDCDADFDKDVNIGGNVQVGKTCDDILEVNGKLNVVCDATFGENVTINNDLTVNDGDIKTNGGIFIGDGSGLVNLNLPGSLRFKGSVNAGGPAPRPAEVGDFYLNNCGDGKTATIESFPDWNFTENFPNGSVVGPNGRIMVLLNQHMIYTADGTWICGSIVESDGYVTLDTTQNITGDKTFTGDYTYLYAPLTEIGTSCGDKLNVNAYSKFLCGMEIGDSTSPCPSGAPNDLDIYLHTNIKCNLDVKGNVDLGNGCSSTYLKIHSPTTIDCDLDVKGNVELGTACGSTYLKIHSPTTIDCNLDVTGNLNAEGNVDIGSGNCSTGYLNVHSPTTIDCDLKVDGNSNLRHTYPQTDRTYDLGSSSKRWRNIYTGDMHFSNEGTGGNSVDGTTGNWTLQEGEDNIYLINNKTGMKFKISMEPVG